MEKQRIFDSGAWINTFLNSDFNDFKFRGPHLQLLTCPSLECSNLSAGWFHKAGGVHISLIYLSSQIHRWNNPTLNWWIQLQSGRRSWHWRIKKVSPLWTLHYDKPVIIPVTTILTPLASNFQKKKRDPSKFHLWLTLSQSIAYVLCINEDVQQFWNTPCEWCHWGCHEQQCPSSTHHPWVTS